MSIIDRWRKRLHIHDWEFHGDVQTDEVVHRECRKCPDHQATSLLRTDWTNVIGDSTCTFEVF